MSESAARYDVVVLGGGPAGQKAAIQASEYGSSVLVIDRERSVGGECTYRGTIPSKTLRESAVFLSGLKRRTGGVVDTELSAHVKLESLMRRLSGVLRDQEEVLSDQMYRNGIDVWRGSAHFTSPDTVCVQNVGTSTRCVRADTIVIATGSRPRRPDNVDVDHEAVLDSDSILSLIYLPRSLAVLGSGVVACEFASIFAALGVQVTIVDAYERPLGFLDPELSDGFVRAFTRMGGTYLPGRRVESVVHDGLLEQVDIELSGGDRMGAEKVLCALGRVAHVRGLQIEAAGLEVTDRGHIPVDEHCRTKVPNIYAIGDVIGPPALAASAMEQGRRAMKHAFGREVAGSNGVVPVGIYTVPELATVGQSEAEVVAELGSAVVGRAPFAELSRGQISANTDGFVKLVCGPDGRKLLGAQVLGEGAADLIHVAQLALIAGLDADTFVDNVFNFPTLTEGYRVAALEILSKRPSALRHAG
ncbi:MAG: Si-specific NAD(P)(+) transhydrogenase [Planctomycetota bacterium]